MIGFNEIAVQWRRIRLKKRPWLDGPCRVVGLGAVGLLVCCAFGGGPVPLAGPQDGSPPLTIAGYMKMGPRERSDLLDRLQSARNTANRRFLTRVFGIEHVPAIRYDVAIALGTCHCPERDQAVLGQFAKDVASGKARPGVGGELYARGLSSPQTPSARAFLRRLAAGWDVGSRLAAWDSMGAGMDAKAIQLGMRRLRGENKFVQLHIAEALIRSQDERARAFLAGFAGRHPHWVWARNVRLLLQRGGRLSAPKVAR